MNKGGGATLRTVIQCVFLILCIFPKSSLADSGLPEQGDTRQGGHGPVYAPPTLKGHPIDTCAFNAGHHVCGPISINWAAQVFCQMSGWQQNSDFSWSQHSATQVQVLQLNGPSAGFGLMNGSGYFDRIECAPPCNPPAAAKLTRIDLGNFSTSFPIYNAQCHPHCNTNPSSPDYGDRINPNFRYAPSGTSTRIDHLHADCGGAGCAWDAVDPPIDDGDGSAHVHMLNRSEKVQLTVSGTKYRTAWVCQ